MPSLYEQLSKNISDYSAAYKSYWSDLETVIDRIESEIVKNLGVPNSNQLTVNGKQIGKYVNVGVKGKVPQLSVVDSAVAKDMQKNKEEMSLTFAIAISIEIPGSNMPVGNYWDLKACISEGHYVFTLKPIVGEEFIVHIARGDARTVSLEKLSTAIFDYINSRYDSSSLK